MHGRQCMGESVQLSGSLGHLHEDNSRYSCRLISAPSLFSAIMAETPRDPTDYCWVGIFPCQTSFSVSAGGNFCLTPCSLISLLPHQLCQQLPHIFPQLPSGAPFLLLSASLLAGKDAPPGQLQVSPSWEACLPWCVIDAASSSMPLSPLFNAIALKNRDSLMRHNTFCRVTTHTLILPIIIQSHARVCFSGPGVSSPGSCGMLLEISILEFAKCVCVSVCQHVTEVLWLEQLCRMACFTQPGVKFCPWPSLQNVSFKGAVPSQCDKTRKGVKKFQE